MVFLKHYFVDPNGRQNFGDAPGQNPKLILTLCHKWMDWDGNLRVLTLKR